MKRPETAYGENAYLSLACAALCSAKRPLSPLEMLEVARFEGFMPNHLFGATMHKTLAARLAEHIRSRSGKSDFYRTAPATFYLHSLATDPNTPAEYKKVHVGHLRSKRIRKENVLVASKRLLEHQMSGEYVPYDENQFQRLYRTSCLFMDRSRAETNDDVKQFVTFTLVLHDWKILTYRRGKFTTTSDTLKGQRSVGFGGHVNDGDFTLFSLGGDAFRHNAARELREELFLDEVYEDPEQTKDRTHLLGYINVDDTEDAEHHIAVLVAFNHKEEALPKKGELSINQLAWLDLKQRLNDLSDFDLWSEMILRGLYDGKLRVPLSISRAKK